MHSRPTRIVIALTGVCWLAASCATSSYQDRQAAIAIVIAAPDRPVSERDRDTDRHAADLLRFSRVAPGERVLDVGSGGGYFTRLLSGMVGPKGQVVAHDAPVYVNNIKAQRETLLASRPNISGMLTPFEALQGEPGSYDLVTIILMYHDIVRLGDRARMNQQIFRLLKAGGRVMVVDHAAPVGTGLRDAGTLHRIDPLLVRSEFEAAGLRLSATSSVLENREDDMSRSSFDPRFRWRTNQFVQLFIKPGK